LGGRRLWLLAMAVSLAGCAGYKLGPTNGVPVGSRSVKIQPFLNRIAEPRITEYLASSLRKQLLMDGTFRLETGLKPDIVLSGEIVRMDRGELSYTTNDVLTPSAYLVILTAQVRAVDTATGKTTLNRPIRGRTYMRIGNDQSSAQREAMPLLTDDLARNTISALVDGDW
jgi:hypothetical protein